MTNLSTLTLAQLATAYNLLAVTPVKKFSDKAAAVKRVEFVLKSSNSEVAVAEDGTVSVHQAAPVAAPVSPRATKVSKHAGLLGKVVASVVEKNPKSRGAAERFGLYVAGQTVADYVAKQTVTFDRTDKQALDDVAWDLDHKFITLK